MKQLLILNKGEYPSSLDANDATEIPAGQAAVMQNGSIVISLDKFTAGNFTILYRRSTDAQVKNFDVDYNSLTISKSLSQEAKAKKMSVIVPATVAKETYGFTIVKKGKTFNERTNYSYSEYAKEVNKQNDVAKALVKVVNANTENTGVKATVSDNTITLENKVGEDFNVTSELCTVGSTQNFTPAVLDKAYVKDLAQRCVGGKGVNYLAEDGKELYPGYPEDVTSDYYCMYTLRFANKRAASSQVGDSVYQTIHVVVPVNNAGVDDGTTTTTSIFKKLMNDVSVAQSDATDSKSVV